MYVSAPSNKFCVVILTDENPTSTNTTIRGEEWKTIFISTMSSFLNMECLHNNNKKKNIDVVIDLVGGEGLSATLVAPDNRLRPGGMYYMERPIATSTQELALDVLTDLHRSYWYPNMKVGVERFRPRKEHTEWTRSIEWDRTAMIVFKRYSRFVTP
eukprot:PhF_6_TR33555/c1_g1_i7/m.48944